MFHLFGGDLDNAAGGVDDFSDWRYHIDSYDTFAAAVQDAVSFDHQWWHIVDETMEIVGGKS